MSSLLPINPANSQSVGPPDDDSNHLPPMEAAASLNLAEVVELQIAPRRGLPNGTATVAVHDYKEKIREVNTLRGKLEDVSERLAQANIKNAVLQERLDARRSERIETIIGAIMSVLGGILIGVGVDFIKSSSGSSSGYVVLFVGSSLLLLSEGWAVWKGRKK